jgi:protease IV
MKQFFKFMFASMLGTFLTLTLLLIISMGIIIGIAASASDETVEISKNTVLLVKLDKTIVDRAPKSPFNFNFSGTEKMMGLDVILENLKKAKKDDNIAGILLNLEEIPAGIATIDEVREGLLDFKKSGKFIWAYSEAYSQASYYLATTADKIYLQPNGGMLFKGLSAQPFFVKGLLEKLDIKVQVVRHGKFKAATEPLFLDKMSKENREQLTAIITDIWERMLNEISEARKISKIELTNLADSLKVQTADDALKYKLVDQLVYKDELISELKKKLALEEKKKVNYVTLDEYTSVAESNKPEYSKDKIAIIYASGSIAGGNGDDQSIGSERISKAIRKAREDDKVKAIVFRINSGGGSALASDVIWREVDLAREVKPVVASFGDVAASGGYYIACAATKIVADPTTITGSIGVFGVIPNMQGLFNKKLGITFDEANTNKNSDYIPVMKPLSPYQTMLIQRDVDHIYDVFIGKVAAGRKLTKAAVDSIGQGRVWSAKAAKSIGLIDEFGGLTHAVTVAADLAKLKHYSITTLPAQKELLEQILEEITGKDPSSKIKAVLGDDYKFYEMVKEIRSMQGVQARMMMEPNIR